MVNIIFNSNVYIWHLKEFFFSLTVTWITFKTDMVIMVISMNKKQKCMKCEFILYFVHIKKSSFK